MRDIKFRAFINKEMISADNLAFEEYGLLKDQLGSEPCLMQYTGLKDKNGVEIYEGDIVEETIVFNSIASVIYKGEGYIPFLYCGGGEMSPETCKVVGNIYQNPELLS